MGFRELPEDSLRPLGRRWRFLDCELDESSYELRVSGVVVDIEPKPLEVLRQLLIHAGDVVTKLELLEAVWPGVLVVDGSLATAVSKVRKALGDRDGVIVTVPRIGYKLAVPVSCSPGSAAPERNVPLAAGERVPGRDQWQLLRRLGRTPSNDVWLAEHVKTRDPRVFKFANQAGGLRSLKREVTVARLLREALGERDDFVRVLEWNFEVEPYFVESGYGGPNFAEWAEQQGGLAAVPWDVRLNLLVQVASTVAAAHGVDLLHKDLKPTNILVAAAADGTPHIKVADFGSASLLVPERLSALGITNLGFTVTGPARGEALAGTAMYVAPEVLSGQVPTAASDVYGLGVLLYQLAVADFRRPIAPGWEADVSDPLIRDDIASAAAGDPSRRLASAAALVERLTGLERRRALARERSDHVASAAPRRRRPLRRWLAWAGVAAAIAVVMTLGFGDTLPIARAPSGVTTVAVLPFQNVSGDASLDFLNVALPDEIATNLRRARGLVVRPLIGASRLEESGLDIRSVARELRADHVVTGRFVKAGDQLHITFEAIDVASNAVTWQDKMDAPADRLISAQAQVALRVRGGLVPALGASIAGPPLLAANDMAYELFLRSLTIPLDPEPNPQGIDMLERSVGLDPGFAPAWVLLARRYYVASRYANGDATIMAKYQAAVERAIALDPGDASTAAAFIVHQTELGDIQGAVARAGDLVTRSPDSADAHFALSYALRFAGALDEAATHCETALLLDPLTQTAGLRSCAIVFFVTGDYRRAHNYANLDRGSEMAKAFFLDILVRQGLVQAALDTGPPKMPQWTSYDMLLACARQAPLDDIEALVRAVKISEDPEANYLAAAHLSYCGQISASAEMLGRAIAGNYCSYPAMESDPLFAGLRRAPEYTDIRAAGATCRDSFVSDHDERRPLLAGS